MTPAHSYFFVQFGLLATAVAVTWRSGVWRDMIRPVYLRRIAFVTGLWWSVDILAVTLDLWGFPAGRTLPFRAFGLPIEEYLGLLTHTVVTFALVRFFSTNE